MSGERILIVDDDLDSLKLISRLLERQGYGVSQAANGPMALDRARMDVPDLIILDLMMPDMDGYEVSRQLRTNPQTAHIPIIMFTAKGLVDDKVAGFEAGADDYLTKPTHPAELTARVRSVLARRGARATNQTGPAMARQARIVAFVGAKGGSGTTTLALNCAVAMAAITRRTPDFRAILAEVKPGQGTLGLLVKSPPSDGLAGLLAVEPRDMTPAVVDRFLVPQPGGLRALLAPIQSSPYNTALTPETSEKLVNVLAASCNLLIFDLGSGLDDYNRRLLPMADQIVLVIETQRISVLLGRQITDELKKAGVNPQRINAVLINRQATLRPFSFQRLQDEIGARLLGVIASAPDLAYEAVETATPMIVIQPNSLPAEQMIKLSRELLGQMGITPAQGGPADQTAGAS